MLTITACTAIEQLPEENITLQQALNVQPSVNTTLQNESSNKIEEPLTENQQKRLLHGQFNFSLLSQDNCDFFIVTFYKNITDTKEELIKISSTIKNQQERIETLLEQLGQTTPGTNAWKKIKDNYDQEQYEYDGLQAQQRILERKIPDMEYTVDEMKQDCKRLKAQPLNRP